MKLPSMVEVRERTRTYLWIYSPALILSAYLYFQFSDPWYIRLPMVLFGGLILQVFGLLAFMMIHYGVQAVQGASESERHFPDASDAGTVAAILLSVLVWLVALYMNSNRLRRLGECMDEYQATTTYEHHRPSGLLQYCREVEKQNEFDGE